MELCLVFDVSIATAIVLDIVVVCEFKVMIAIVMVMSRFVAADLVAATGRDMPIVTRISDLFVTCPGVCRNSCVIS